MTARPTIAIIGAGRIGRVLGSIIETGPEPCHVRFWDSQPGLVVDQQTLPATLNGVTAILFAIPARALATFADILPTLPTSVSLVVISKGMPTPEWLSPAEYLQAICPGHPVVVIGGPMMAEEMSAKHPGHAVIAGTDTSATQFVAGILKHAHLNIMVSHDPISVSRAGVLKNVYGCISGMLDGLGLAVDERSGLQSWLIDEFQATGAALKIPSEIITGPAGLGDLAITTGSRNSRNRGAGEALVRTGVPDTSAESMHSLIDITNWISPELDAPLLQAARRFIRHEITADSLMPEFTKHIPKAGPLYSLPASRSAKKTTAKKYATLEAAMTHDSSLPPSHAALLREYEAAGWHHVHIRHDAPKAIYPPHYHPDEVVLHVLEGELDVEIDGQHKIIPAGQKVDVAAERFHTTCVGPQGCIYLHAEKHVASS